MSPHPCPRHRPRPRARRWASGLVGVVAAALLAGCVQMPTSGPVVESDVGTDTDDAPGISFDPAPPQAGQSAAEIVAGFLEAMKATPISLTVARQFLSDAAADTWAPENQIITYAELGEVADGSRVRVPLVDVNSYDARGAWQRTDPAARLSLGLVLQDGEWRIDDVPDALVVPDSWFADSYERASLYYLDPSAEVLVAEPVYAPRGDQYASSLVRGLVTEPSADSADVVRTFLPVGATPGLSVPIVSGIARVALGGDPATIDEAAADRMRAQVVWTLRQDDRINAVELSVGGQSFGTPGSSQVGLDVGSAFDPDGPETSTALYALDAGRVVRGAVGAFGTTQGPLGQGDYDLRSIGVSLDGAQVAGVGPDGTTLLVAPTDTSAAPVSTVVDGAVDLAEPGWDHAGRTWVLDRAGGRARVIFVDDQVATEVLVPGLTGRRLTRLLVSRDGTRLVAVERRATGDAVVSVRVRHDAAGTVAGFTAPVDLPLVLEAGSRVRDIGWRSPTTVSVLTDIAGGSQVRTLSVDGAPGDITTTGTSRVRGPNRVLVSSPDDGEAYVVAGRAISSLTRPERPVPDLPEGLTSLTYVG